jgi:hypothetical protein
LRIGAGIPERWRDSASGVGIRDLRTPFGSISWSLRPAPGGTLRLVVEGEAVPPGGIELAFPWLAELTAIEATEGELTRVAGRAPVIRSLPASISLAR